MMLDFCRCVEYNVKSLCLCYDAPVEKTNPLYLASSCSNQIGPEKRPPLNFICLKDLPGFFVNRERASGLARNG